MKQRSERNVTPLFLVLSAFLAACSGDPGGEPVDRPAPDSGPTLTDGAPTLTDGGPTLTDGAPDAACDPVNACGGCTLLPASLHTPCPGDGGASVWACASKETLACVVAGAPRNVVASTNDSSRVRVTWSSPLSTVPDSYVVIRDGASLATVAATPGASTLAFDDATTAAGSAAAPPSITATDGTWAGGVRVSWSPAAGVQGVEYGYEVHAVYTGLQSAPSSPSARGRRGAPTITGYDVEVRGSWVPAGLTSTFEDTAAPLGTLWDSSPTPWGDVGVSAVRLAASVMKGTAAAAGVYRVRARMAGDLGAPSAPATGTRGFGTTVTTQWQRSLADSDANYTDLPDVTGLQWYDDTAPLDGSGRYYRAAVRSEGAQGITQGRRATLTGFTALAALNGTTCGLRNTDGALVCWGSFVLTETQGAPYTKLFAKNDTVCAFQADAHAPICFSLSDPTPIPPPPAVVFTTLDPVGRCGLTAGGQILCWDGSPTPPPDVQFRAFAAWGSLGGCGLRTSDSKPTCWPDYLAVGVPDVSLEDIVAGASSFCGRRSTDHVPVCWGAVVGGVVSPAVPMKKLAGDYSMVCGVREADDKVGCWPDYPTSDAHLFDLVGPSADAFHDVQVVGSSVCGTRVADGKRMCRGMMRLVAEAGGDFSAGWDHVCVLHAGGSVRCTGYNRSGQSPALFPKEHFARVFMGPTTTCGIRSGSGELDCLPRGSDSEVPASLGAVDSAAFGAVTACALRRSDHKRVCWGPSRSSLRDLHGTSPDAFSFLTDGGANVLLGIRAADSSLVLFGATWLLPAGSFVAGASSPSHGCAIRSADHRVECWGDNAKGQAPPGPSVDAFDEVAAGDGFTCGVRRPDGVLLCWGVGGPSTPTAFAVKSLSARRLRLSALVASDDRLFQSGDLTEALRSVAVAPSSFGTDAPGEVCFVKYDGHLGCR